jgi:hypothetical protein
MRLPFSRSRISLISARWALAALLIAAPAAVFSMRALGAVRPTVENPHGKFKADCALCHAAASWTPAKISAKFNHASYGFPLTGAHATTKCMACHASLEFSQSKQLCANCHQDPHRGEMGTECARCHSARSFTDRSAMVRAHQATRFPLTGSHAQIDCETCHKPTAQGKMQFVGTKADCQNCHMDQYRAAKNPDHVAGGMPTDCASCHTTLTWSTKSFDHNKTAFPLTGAHITVACLSCHVGNVFKGTSTQCISCHKKDYDGTTAPVHSSAGYSTDCTTCHNTTSWAGANFDHSKTQFPLTGAHVTVACSGCHGDGVYAGKSMLCYSCHKTNFDATVNPPHGAAGFATTCQTCHTTASFLTATFNHSTQTTFPLTGAHQALACSGCHADGVYKGKSTLCISCHTADYATPVVNHTAAGFANTCLTCHTTTAWNPGAFNHSTQTTFPLTGTHSSQMCNACHTTVFKGLSTTCDNCHHAKYTATTNPPHASTGFPVACETCHDTIVWTDGKFNHTTNTTFPLTGAHQTVTCNGCHSSGVYKGLSMLCISCHQTDYATPIVNHTAAGFANTCQNCHTTTAWNPGTFNHSTQTTFPLTGTHSSQLCNACHTTVFKGLSTTCDNCHHTNYTGTTNPPHVASGFPVQCETCHDTVVWTNGKFNHSTQTTFPLTGAHVAVACNQCHSSGVYKGLSTLCYSCHKTEYGTTVINHVASGFGTNCESCHTTTQWAGASFNHTTMTTFPLTGAHQAVACSGCHGDGVYAGKSTLCYSCHKTDYATPIVNHTAAGFATTCENCHNTTLWNPGTFNHTTQTTFPLTGTHTTAACSGCHTTIFKGLSTLCYGCHKTEYSTPVFDHVAAGFPTTCETCHNTTVWSGTTFNHSTQTTFPLTGAHTTVACSGCHGGGVYKGLSTLCYSCHKTDYATTVVNHVAAGFNTTCETCHTTTAWSGAKYANHDTVFPIYSGRHTQALARWTGCTDCHQNTANYAVWSCEVSCHQNTANDSTHKSKNAAGRCYSCHPKGSAG